MVSRNERLRRIRHIWSWLGLNLGKHAGLVSVIGLVVTIGLGLGIVRLHFVTSNASYLNANDQAQIENSNYESHFGGDPMVVMFTMAPGKKIDQFFTQSNISAMRQVQSALNSDRYVYSAISPLDGLVLANRLAAAPGGNLLNSLAARLLGSALNRDNNKASHAKRLDYLLQSASLESAIPIADRVLSNPKWDHFLLFNPDGTVRNASIAVAPNPTHVAMIVFLQPNLSIDNESKGAVSVENIVKAQHFDNVTVLVTGVPALLKTINDYLKSGTLTLGGFAAIAMVLILLLLFTVRWRLLAFAIVAVGLVWAFGLAGYIGVPLTLASIAGLPVLLGVGIDYAIQMHSRVEEEVLLDRAAHPIQASARHLGPALLVVTFDAVFAFLALLFSKVPMIRQFGWLLLIGVVAVCVCSIIGPLAVLGIREYKSPTKGKDFSTGALSRLTVWLGSVPAKAALPFALISVVVFAGGLAVEGHLTLQTDPLQWINPGAPTVKDVNALKAGIGTDNDIAALVHTDHPWSDQTAAYLTSFANQEERQFPSLLFPATGIVNLVYEFISVPGTLPIPPLGSDVEAVYKVAPPGLQKVFASNGGADLAVIFESRTATLDELQPVVQSISASSPPAGITSAPGGIAVVGVGLLKNLSSTRTLLTYLSIIFVGLFLMLRLRSILRSLLSLVPVLVAVGAVSLVAYAMSLKLSPMTAVSGPLVVAVCTEFTSLILLRFVEERALEHTPAESMHNTAARTGRAFIVSGLTAVVGVAVIASSPWPLLRGFGTIVGLNVLIALICALVILPPVLVWAESGDRNWVSRGLIPEKTDDDIPGDEPVPVQPAPALT